ncbi:MAG: hypothetical protein K2J15_00030, partial [Muribaculaceae bacterium]|nr:hypothetical protein [Muribaculaceae bacterium]
MDESNQTKEDIRNGGTKALLRARLKKAELLGEPDPSSEDTLISGYAADLLELYPVGSPLNGSLISSLYKMGRFNTNSLASRKELYRLVRDASEYEKGKIKQYLDYIADRLLIPEYTLTTQAQWLPQGNTISIDSKNITDGYLLMVPISYSQAESGKLRNRDLKATGTIRVVCHIAAKAGEPTEETQQISVNDLTPGYYALVMSGNKDLSGIFQRTLLNKPDLVLVSSLSCFTSDDSRLMKLSETPDGKERMSDKYLYIVNGRDNSPIKGATVEFSNSDYDKRFEKKILTTDSQGKVLLPYARCQAVITHGNDRLKWSGNKNYAPVEQTSRLRANIFTDLAIYHPGDSIRIATVIIQSDGRDVETVSDKEVEIKLVNANHEEVGQVTVRTDSYGRAITALQIPATGLTGRFVIYVKDGKRIIGTSSVEVAEYKAPSFRVILDRPEVEKTDPADTSSAGTGIILTGSVMTYSGVPLSSAEVELNVRFDPWWSRWLRSAPPADDFGATVSTDSNGRFRVVITLPADGASSYNYGRFYATATATSSAGETRMSDRQGFAVGEGYSLSFRGNSEIEVDDDLKLQISVVDILDQPVVKDLHYSLTQLDYAGEKEEKIISEGTFKSPVLKLDPSIIPSGAYRLKVVLPEAVRVTENNLTTWKPDSLDVKVIFWRKNDTRPPVATPLWTPQPIYYATPGESHVMVTVGAGYEDEWIYMQISNQEGTLRREWLRPSGKNMRIKVDAPAAGECITLYFAGCHDLSRSKSFVKIYPAEADKKTLFRVDTFRDRIVPGNQETWRFRLMSGWASPDGLKGDDGMSPLGNAAVMAVMSNEALDALVPFRWNFNPRMYVNYSALGGIEFPWSRQLNVTRDLRGISYMENPVQFPLLTFLYSDVSGKKIFYSVSSKAVVTGAVESDKADGVVMDYELPVANMSMKRSSSEMASEANMELEEETVEDAVSGDGLSDDGEGELCGMEMPLAFFNPSLTTDSEGYVEVEFTVPDFNTTWAFQILGYDRSGNAAVDRMTARASKPVMVPTLMPRFLLTGDHAYISATIFNALEDSLIISGRIEVFDVISGRIIACSDMPDTDFEGNSSKVISVEVNVPADVNQLGVRTIAQSEKGSDGEQGIVQVLPSSTPVRDATTFYLSPGEKEFSIRLPNMHSAGNVTLNYCDDPYWYVLTSLSGKLYPESESALEQAVALYSVAVSAGILDQNPRLREGLKHVSGDNGEKSPIALSQLNKSQSLKISALNETPWVNNAESETMRVNGLEFLLDSYSVKKAISDAVDGLEKTHNPD